MIYLKLNITDMPGHPDPVGWDKVMDDSIVTDKDVAIGKCPDCFGEQAYHTL